MTLEPLPDFEKPPLNEVALSVQFSAQPGPLSPHFGVFWSQSLRSKFPKVEEQLALEPETEQFNERPPVPRNPFRVTENVETPRCWFTTESGNELIQLQHDRLIHNWRLVEDDVSYPRYPSLRGSFATELQAFDQFMKTEELGKIEIDQCEVTYVNHLPKGEGWESFGDAHDVFSLWSPPKGGSLPQPEDVRFEAHFRIPAPNGEPAGRLRIILAPAYRLKDNKKIFVLTLMARGKPWDAGIDGALSFLDLAHEWIVRGFAEVTTPLMHKHWGRIR